MVLLLVLVVSLAVGMFFVCVCKCYRSADVGNEYQDQSVLVFPPKVICPVLRGGRVESEAAEFQECVCIFRKI